MRGVTNLCYAAHVPRSLELYSEYRAANRTFILTLAGFSFSALPALSIYDSRVPGSPLRLEVYYLLVSFLCYYAAMNLQKYPFGGWHQQADVALMESASL
jgi:hypothetical protein